MKINDLSGQQFGELTAIRDVGSKKYRRMWECKCSCGQVVVVSSNHLKRGNTKSCGCLKMRGWNVGNFKTQCKRGHDLAGDNLYVSPKGTRGCRACRSLYKEENPPDLAKAVLASQRWRDNNEEEFKAYQRKYDLWKNYGITVEEFEAKLTEQAGKCAICNSLMDRPCVDHDHDTDEVRGLLCRTCNSGIGLLKDDILIAQSAVDYLKKWKAA